MKLTSYYDLSIKLEDLNKDAEYIFAFKDFSRHGNLTLDQISEFTKLKNLGFDISLEIDLLLTQTEFVKVIKKINDLDQNLFQKVRLQDPGLIQHFKENFLESKIGLILETGNHNLAGVQSWCDYLGDQLDRVILSPELPKNKIHEFINRLNVPIELLGMGPILVFYTPRMLLSNSLNSDVSSEELWAIGKSEESPHKGFPLFENQHGTFMYHIKDFCLLDEINELKKMGLTYFRFDPRQRKKFEFINLIQRQMISSDNTAIKKIKLDYEYDIMKGYYRINKTDILFPKLKNSRIKRKDLNFVGTIIETFKERYLAIEVKENILTCGEDLKIINPLGSEVSFTVKSLRDVSFANQSSIPSGQIAIVNYHRGITAKSAVYIDSKT